MFELADIYNRADMLLTAQEAVKKYGDILKPEKCSELIRISDGKTVL